MGDSSFRRLIESDDIKIGTFIGEFSTPGIGRILASTGCQFALVDMEHSGFSFETLKSVLRVLHEAGVSSIVKTPSTIDHHIARACDAGAQGVMPPKMQSADDARSILSAMKYPPVGSRGVALHVAHDNYMPGSHRTKFDEANLKTTLVAIIEDAEGIANADEIAAVDGVDALWIGQFDLSCALGVPGEYDSAIFKDASAAVCSAAAKHRKPIGRSALTVDEGAALIAQGFRFIMYSGDMWLIQMALEEGIGGLRRAAALLSNDDREA